MHVEEALARGGQTIDEWTVHCPDCHGPVPVGVGDEAGEIAGRTRSEGQLYYLFLAEDRVARFAP